MRAFGAALWTELLKARRSKVPALTAAGFTLAPLVGGFFMIIAKDPVQAKELGLLGAKAQLIIGSPDWATYLGFLAQAMAVGGILLFGLVISWIFGREFTDRTVNDWLALPVPRAKVIAAKFVVVCLWCLFLSIMILLIGLVVGSVVGLDGWTIPVFTRGWGVLTITTILTILLMTPVAFVASIGRGYLAPMGFLILLLVFAQVLGAIGWGWVFPWSVGGLYAGISGTAHGALDPISYWLVVFTGIIGVAMTFVWWRRADQIQ